MPSRRLALESLLAAGAGMALPAGSARAQTAVPLRIVVPFATGGATDVAARVVAPLLGEALKRATLVENKVGATGAIGAEAVARGPADGNTLLFGTSSAMAANPAVTKVPFDPVADFAPVGMVATVDNILVVHPSVPVHNVREFIAYAKAYPDRLAYGSSGIGSTYHMGAELFRSLTGVGLTHVPYKGQGPASHDLVAGHIQVMFDAFNTALPQIRAGKVRALGIASARRHPELPDLPTIIEQGVAGYETAIWLALFAPAATPRPAVERLSEELFRIVSQPAVRERFANIGMQPLAMKSDELAGYLKAELVRWAKVARDAGIRS